MHRDEILAALRDPSDQLIHVHEAANDGDDWRAFNASGSETARYALAAVADWIEAHDHPQSAEIMRQIRGDK